MTVTIRRLAIVGAGPLCTYALERLAALLRDAPFSLEIVVFDRGGHFGAGATHAEDQAPTSYLNRVASQIAFAADESNADATRLLPSGLRPTFAEWTVARYHTTSDARFALGPRDTPHRHLHGIALREAFERYVELLRSFSNVRIELYAGEVVDLEPEGVGFRLHVMDAPAWSLVADHVLLVTGHSHNHAVPNSTAAVLAAHAAAVAPGRYVPNCYPLHERACESAVPPHAAVGVLGLGLTAVDILLFLTEGRGGRFVRREDAGVDDAVRYLRSGREPRTIVAVSPSGMFTSCRPINDKAVDASGVTHSMFEHQGVFLTTAAIRELRRNLGVPVDVGGTVVEQIDFERHVFPLVILEMAYVYYTVLFGAGVGPELRAIAAPGYREFLTTGCLERGAGADALVAPVLARCDEIAAAVAHAASGPADGPTADALAAFTKTVYGDGGRIDTSSPWDHAQDANAHRFDWRKLFEPLGTVASGNGGDWQNRLLEYMRKDHLAAAQGNIRNPTKAACDGVWRDLRAVYSEAADFGGLTASSQRRFAQVYWRHYSRMSNGTGLEAMRKIVALIEAGVVDVAIGPSPIVEPIVGQPRFRLRSERLGIEREVDIVIEGRCHPFDPEHDVHPLYPNLLRRGLIHRWRNPGGDGPDFVPGGLDVTRAFHPVRADSHVEPRITILGAPVEGIAYFQLSAARPGSNSSILNMVARWANELFGTLIGAEGIG